MENIVYTRMIVNLPSGPHMISSIGLKQKFSNPQDVLEVVMGARGEVLATVPVAT